MPDPVALFLAGRISAPVALARLVLDGASDVAIAARLDGDPRAGALRLLWAERRAAVAALRSMLAQAGVDHAGSTDPAAVAALFDRAVSRAPEASVAAWSLGDPAILAQATEELVAWLAREALIGPNRDVLDLGCGIGRVAAALAPRVRSVLGLDVSAGMIEEARLRHPCVPGLRFDVTSGADFSALPGGAFDLVLAVDSFPYLVQAGVAEAHLRDAARLLRPGGAVAILNLSYRGDPEADRADAGRWAAAYGFALIRDGEAPFRLWDGTAYVLRRAG